jgi:DNA-binding MarR family transcriptional regulator
MALKKTPEEVRALVREYMSPDEERVWWGLLATHERVTRELDREMMREHRIPLTTFDALAQIAHAPDGEIAISELAEQVRLSPSRVSRLVMELEREGLVTRRRSDDDGRSTRAAITEPGRERLGEGLPTYLTAIREQLLDGLSQTDVKALARSFDKLGARAASDS